MQTLLPGRSARIHAPGRSDVVHDPPARRERGRQARLGVLAGDGHVDVHRVAQRLRRVELLHPDRRARGRAGRCRCRRASARSRGRRARSRRRSRRAWRRSASWTSCTAPRSATAPLLPRHRGDGPRELDVPRLRCPQLAGQPHREPIRRRRSAALRRLEAGHLRDRRGQPRRIDERRDPEDRRRARRGAPPSRRRRRRRGTPASPVRSCVDATRLEWAGHGNLSAHEDRDRRDGCAGPDRLQRERIDVAVAVAVAQHRPAHAATARPVPQRPRRRPARRTSTSSTPTS